MECLAKMSRAPYLVSLELPGLGSDELLGVIANYCENLEVLNIQGSREAVTDRGFSRYVQESGNKAKRTLRQLDVSRCMLTQVTLVHLQELIGTYIYLLEWIFSITVLPNRKLGIQNEPEKIVTKSILQCFLRANTKFG